MKFDYIIMNPPYKGSLHLNILKHCIDCFKDSECKLFIIEPATWLINIRKNGKAKLYNTIKDVIKNNAYKIVIENCNSEFNTELFVPFSITYIDFSKSYNNINYVCCGDSNSVNSIYDCNLIGEYNIVWSILNKVLAYKDMMVNHITKAEIKDNYYLPYSEIIQNHYKYTANADWIKTSNGEFYTTHTTPCCHKFRNNIYNMVGKNKVGNIDYCVYGTKKDLENWKYFVYNNKLPLFINMCLTFDQHNNSKQFIPWLVDKKYTDDEINKLFNFTDDEINLINKTVKKFERNSLWVKRYMSNSDSVSNNDIKQYYN